MGGTCSTYGERKVPYKVLVGNLGRKRQLGKSRRRWVDNIKISVKEIGR